MDHQYNVSRSSKAVTNFALLFFWIAVPITTYLFLATIFALATGQAILNRAIIALIGSTYGLFLAITLPLQTVNQYNRIRATEEGLQVEVYIFRYIWKLVCWDEILELKLLSRPDRWGKPQWLLRVRRLTYWHRWISWQYQCGSDPGILINSDLVDRDELLKIIDDKLSRKAAETSKRE